MKTANVSKRMFAALLAVLMFVGMLPFGALGFTAQAAEVTGASLASIPAVRGDVKSASGAFTLTSQSRFYIVSDTDPTGTALGTYVQTASSEFAAEGKPSAQTLPIVYGAEANAAEGDIVIKVDSSLGKSEMYNLTVTSTDIKITASDAAGVLHALHTILQSMVKGNTNSLACVTASDWPDVPERSVYVDCGRVFFSVSSIKAMIRTLSWNKMNVLYLDFSNNNATRFFLNNMTVTVDGTDYDLTKAKPSNGYWTESDMDEIIAEAGKYGVRIIPTFNSPGHIGGLRSVNSAFFKSKSAEDYDSGTGKVALNISNENAYSFGQKTVALYVDYFASKGCDSFNIAADEATDAIAGLDSTGTAFVSYINDLNAYIKSKGMTTRMFNDAIKSVHDGIDSDITVLCWTPSTPSPDELVEAGHNVVNFDWEFLYYAHGASSYWNCNTSVTYAWNPGSFKNDTSSSGYEASYNSGSQPAYSFSGNSSDGKILGANFAIWTDYAHTQNQTGEDVLKEKSCKYQSGSYGLRYKIYIVAERSWSRKTDSVNYDTWKNGVMNAPGGLDVSTGSALGTSIPAAQPITAAPVPVENVTLTDETTGITVTAPGITRIVCTPAEARTISVASDVRSYDIKVYTDDGAETAYQGEAEVSLPIPAEWDLSKVTAYGVTDGEVEFIKGTPVSGAYKINVTHFSEYGLALLNSSVPDYADGTVSSDSGTVTEYVRASSVSAGDYIIVPSSANTVALGYDGKAKTVSVSGTKLTLGSGVKESDVLWTFTGSGNSYKIKNGSNNLYPSSNSSSPISQTNSGNITVSGSNTFSLYRSESNNYGRTYYYYPSYRSSSFSTSNTRQTSSIATFYLFKKTETTSYTVDTSNIESLIAYANGLTPDRYSNWQTLGVTAKLTAAKNALSAVSNPYSDRDTANARQTAVNTAGKDLYDALMQLLPYEYSATVTVKPVCNGVSIGADQVYYVYGSSDPFSATVTLPQIEGYTHASYKYVVSGLASGESKVIEVEYKLDPEYILLPISLIDYRSDGLLFDWNYWQDNSYAYSLVHSYQNPAHGTDSSSSSSTDYGYTIDGSKLGTSIDGTKLEIRKRYSEDIQSAWSSSYYLNGGWIRSGMVESELGANGLPVYTDATVRAVAELLADGIVNNGAITSAQNTNKILYNTFLKSGADRSVLNTSTTAMSDSFAANKSYANISNAYDLAWYLLNNLFVGDTNTVEDNGHTVPIYGMGTDTFKQIALRKKTDSSGNIMYAYDSAYATTYDTATKTIYNTDVPGDIITTKPKSNPNLFYPLENSGYESADIYGSKTTSQIEKNSPNGNFTLVGSAQFVYKADDYFYFSGDDDVYLFVNGKLVLDLGGAHGVCYKEINLADFADECGLVEGEVATFTFFYMERCSDNSNFSMRTNLTLAEVDLGVEKNAYSDNTDTGVQIANGSVIETGRKAYYEIAVENRSNVEISGISITDTDSAGNTLVIGKAAATDFVLDNPSYPSAADAKRVDVALNDTFSMYKRDASGAKVAGSEQTFETLSALSRAVASATLEAGYKLCVRFTNAALYVGPLDSYSYTNNVTARISTGNTASASHTIYTHSYGTNTNVSYVVDFGLPLKLKSDDLPIIEDVVSIALSPTNDTKNGTVKLEGYQNSNGTYDPTSITLTYTPNKIMNSIDLITLDLTYRVSGTRTVTFAKTVAIIPASIVYYEDNDSFIKFDEKWEKVEEDNSSASQAAQRLGTENAVYGYDKAYADNTSKYSNGGVHKVTLGDKQSATANFTFKGTGFDLISLTGSTTGTIVVTVTNASGYSRNILVDTYYGYTKDADGKWVVDTNANGALYQIPVVKVEGLAYGEYSVKITATYHSFFDHTGANQYELYIDAVRIYNPLGDNGNSYYSQDGEGWPKYEELRNLVIASDEIKKDATENGVVFIDGDPANAKISDYITNGPKNELYLTNGQAIAFNVTADTNVKKIELAMKSADGNPVTVKVLSADGTVKTHTIASSTDLYYAIPTEGLVIVTNTGDGILSVTNMKTTYKSAPASSDENAAVTVNKAVADEAVLALNAFYSAPTVFEPEYISVNVSGSTVREGGYVTVTVKTSADVEAVTVNGIAMRRMLTVRGERSVWTATVKASKVGELRLDVVAANADNITSEAITETVTVTEKIEISGILEDIFKKLSDRWFR